jgi:aquaporin Z
MILNKFIAEFFGTYIFLFVIIATGNAWVIGLTLALVIYLLGNISGGNFNPAVTVMMVYAKKQPYSDLVPYVVVQIVGGLAALQTYKYLKVSKVL